MPYRFTDWRALDEEPARIAREQLDRALGALGDERLDDATRVHEARKRCKKLRALLRLVRPALAKGRYRTLNDHFRDAARRVSDNRDAVVFTETYDRVCGHYAGEIDRRGTASIRAALTRRARERARALGASEGLERLNADLERGRALLDEGLALEGTRFDALLAGFARTYARAREGLAEAAEATDDAELFHEWRKRVKYHRLQLKLLGPLWPIPLGALEREADRLGEMLGDAHDIAELDAHLAAEPDGLGDRRHVDSFLAFARALRAGLEAEALPLGRCLFTDKDKRVVKRLAAWHAARGVARDTA